MNASAAAVPQCRGSMCGAPAPPQATSLPNTRSTALHLRTCRTQTGTSHRPRYRSSLVHLPSGPVASHICNSREAGRDAHSGMQTGTPTFEGSISRGSECAAIPQAWGQATTLATTQAMLTLPKLHPAPTWGMPLSMV